jgi:uncharacterized protein (TIGR02594 family)
VRGRAANSEWRVAKRRAAFAIRHSLFAFSIALCLCGSAEARGRPPATAQSPYSPLAAPTSPLLAEAARWLGSGNPTGYPEAWCRDFVNFVLRRAGHRLADDSHLAIAALRLGPRVAEPRPGDLAVMAHHVTFFAGWDGAGAFLGLGGNQGRRVRVSRFARRAVIAFVRPI